MAKAENRAGEVMEGKKERDAFEGAVNSQTVKRLKEGMPENLSSDVQRRLELDLFQNKTADYSRINLSEIHLMFHCDVETTITHWRVAKIMDAIIFFNVEMKMLKSGISPKEIPEKIYAPLMAGQANYISDDKEDWPWQLTYEAIDEEGNSTGQTKTKSVSLVDLTYMYDTVRLNSSIAGNRMPLKVLLFNFLEGKDIKISTSYEDEVVQDGTKILKTITKEVDLLNGDEKDENGNVVGKLNPKDDYQGIDIRKYIKQIKSADVNTGLQMVAIWREESEGHREVGGHASFVKNETILGGAYYIPLSGRMAAEITYSDLQKSDKGGMMGQPQELGDMDEAASGAIIRFRLRDLLQRQKGSDVRSTQKLPRVAKAMVGMILPEDAKAHKTTEVVGKDKNGDPINKTAVYIAGKEGEPAAIISGMKASHDNYLKKIRGRGLSENEAYDLVFTDVIAPCIINNETDWLSALGDVYQVGGTRGATSLTQNRERFQGFVLNIKCRDMDKPGHPIEWKPFNGMAELRAYLYKRVSAGHIDQPGAAKYAPVEFKPPTEIQFSQEAANSYAKKILTDEEGAEISALLHHLLGGSYKDYIKRYISEGPNAEIFSHLVDADGQIIKKGKGGEEQKTGNFAGAIGQILGIRIREDDQKVIESLEKIFDKDFSSERDLDPMDIAAGLWQTLLNLTNEEDRKKIK